MTGRQRKVLKVIADAGPLGVTSGAQVVAKAAGRKPAMMVSRLKDLGYVRNVSGSKIAVTQLGFEALSAANPEAEKSLRRQS